MEELACPRSFNVVFITANINSCLLDFEFMAGVRSLQSVSRWVVVGDVVEV